jgi:hypothetical protein
MFNPDAGRVTDTTRTFEIQAVSEDRLITLFRMVQIFFDKIHTDFIDSR